MSLRATAGRVSPKAIPRPRERSNLKYSVWDCFASGLDMPLRGYSTSRLAMTITTRQTITFWKPPRGKAHLADWLEENKDRVGAKYTSEIKKHYE
jgi:hypothetical protein